jgi:hypothetical protein
VKKGKESVSQLTREELLKGGGGGRKLTFQDVQADSTELIYECSSSSIV